MPCHIQCRLKHKQAQHSTAHHSTGTTPNRPKAANTQTSSGSVCSSPRSRLAPSSPFQRARVQTDPKSPGPTPQTPPIGQAIAHRSSTTCGPKRARPRARALGLLQAEGGCSTGQDVVAMSAALDCSLQPAALTHCTELHVPHLPGSPSLSTWDPTKSSPAFSLLVCFGFAFAPIHAPVLALSHRTGTLRNHC